MIIFVHFYFPFSVHCYIIIYKNTYLKVKVESLDSKIHELESENKQLKICNEALKKCLKEVL